MPMLPGFLAIQKQGPQKSENSDRKLSESMNNQFMDCRQASEKNPLHC